ncbi:type III-A CRISPR-associated RAMP protein Csm5 [Diplocloster hominis]|uniref:type III-A CRISPR-associated RAMP protein Csm5 n=1 Tax=Diplocloster hominis TaxID=3079010 RepID=UPI0031BB1193
MIREGYLESYQMILETRAPVFVGNGKSCSKVEYYMDANKRMVSVLDDEKFFSFLIERGLVEKYEAFITNPFSGYLYKFLSENSVTEQEVASFTRYTIRCGEGLEAGRSLKEIWMFYRDRYGRPYIPGSSLKGALRTALLTGLLLQKNGLQKNDLNAKRLEQTYLNTLQVTDHPGDEQNSIMRGFAVSDSETISPDDMVLCGKWDMSPSGNIKQMPLVRECVRTGVKIRSRITIDRRIWKDWNLKFLEQCIQDYGKHYKDTYLPYYMKYKGGEFPVHNQMLVVGGGCGYFSKNIAYAAMGKHRHEQAVKLVSSVMKRQFPKHFHDKDELVGISPRNLKCTYYNRDVYHYGVCTVGFK